MVTRSSRRAPHSADSADAADSSASDGPAAAQASAVQHLQVLPGVPGQDAPLSAAARAYNQQLARIAKLKTQLADMDAVAHAHRQALTQRIHPLHQRQWVLTKDLALWLDAQLTQAPPTTPGTTPSATKLTPTQRQVAVQIVCNLAAQLVDEGHADMVAVHDRHSPRTLAEMARDHAQAMKAHLEEMLGETLVPDQPDASLDEVMRAARAHMQQAVAENDAKREAAAAKRQAKKATKTDKKPPNEAQLLQQSLQGDADTTLRKLYRQLASALHPDRETDPTVRLAKTALMSEANAAYARQDVVTLMDIQQRAALADPNAATRLPDDKLKALTLLVKAQVAELERQRARTQQGLYQEFGVHPSVGLTAKTLEMLRMELEADLEDTLYAIQADLTLVQQPAGFKRWLTQQRKLSQQRAREVTRGGVMGDWAF